MTFLANPAQGNRYLYAADDPINNVDPTGEGIWSCIGGGVSAAGGFLGVAGGIGSALGTGGLGVPASLGIAGAGLGAIGGGMGMIDDCGSS